MIKVNFYEIDADAADQGREDRLKFAVIVSRYDGKWVFCKHRNRDTLESPGGTWEEGERIEQTARRELYEETGALEYDLYPVVDYGVERDNGEESLGRLYYAQIHKLGPMPEFEIERIELRSDLPTAWTFPDIQPKLLEKIKNWLTTAGI